jgi:hypothetical protein
VIAGERADQAVRELPTDRGLEAIAGARPSVGETPYAGTVIEQAADGLAVGGRRGVHGTLVIGPRARRRDPWRE